MTTLESEGKYIESKPEDFTLAKTARVTISPETLRTVTAPPPASEPRKVTQVEQLRTYIAAHYDIGQEFRVDDLVDGDVLPSLSERKVRLTMLGKLARQLVEEGWLQLRYEIVKREEWGGTRRSVYRRASEAERISGPSEKLKMSAKTREKEERLLTYINNRPYGQRFQATEAATALGISTHNLYALLRSAIRLGKVYRHETGLHGKFYTVAAPVNVINKPTSVPKRKPTPEPSEHDVIDQEDNRYRKPRKKATASTTAYDLDNIKAKAMMYAWDNHDDLPAVRRFIEWLAEH